MHPDQILRSVMAVFQRKSADWLGLPAPGLTFIDLRPH